MPDQPRLIYWDACIFLDYLEGAPQWVTILEAILEDASTARDFFIVTSTLSLVEVAYATSERSGQLNSEVLETIEAFWLETAGVLIVDVDQVIAREARTLIRRAIAENRSLKPADALHLATGVIMQISEFQTTDDRLQRWNDLGFPVHDPWTDRPRLGI